MYSLELFLDKFCDLFELTIKNNGLDNITTSSEKSYTYIINYDFTETAFKIADVLTEFVISNFEADIVKNLIHSDYTYFSNSEREEIINKVLDVLTSDSNELIKMLVILKRRFLIKQCFLNFITENSYINICGFTKFRLIEYKKLLSDLIEKIINDFKVQNEYKEFIAMLKFFVDTQKNRASKLHIIFEKDGGYTILNDLNKDITDDCFRDFIKEKQNHSLTNEDLLISSLITLAPKKIIVHLSGSNYNKKILSTIEQIFTNKVILNESVPNLQLLTN